MMTLFILSVVFSTRAENTTLKADGWSLLQRKDRHPPQKCD